MIIAKNIAEGCIATKIGRFKLVANETALLACQLTTQQPSTVISHPILKPTCEQLWAYLEDHLQQFTIPLQPQGTPFQQTVWQTLQTIPYGKTATYKTIAQMIKHPKAVRAVGNANKHNPIMLLIPCHRVVPSNGGVGGYAHGQSLKLKLLQHEANYLQLNE